MHTHTHARTHARTHTYTNTHTHMIVQRILCDDCAPHWHTHTHTHTHTQTHTQTHTHTCVCVCVRVMTKRNTHTHTNTNTHYPTGSNRRHLNRVMKEGMLSHVHVMRVYVCPQPNHTHWHTRTCMYKHTSPPLCLIT